MTEEELDEAARADPDAQPFDTDFLEQARFITPPNKKLVRLQIDVDVLEWFKQQDKGYQARMNAALRDYMNRAKEQILHTGERHAPRRAC